ncbi:unnamed protein product [Meganyctiphanes norvegica]|uniref:NADH dehydrogenase [ubiquinone] 1 beta subcomplex subunit 5, mitochondrial n=1 Tax=Meganyctiphanes norvegica TaxID=48144 RepID=A0AAV2SE46_MEGNR
MSALSCLRSVALKSIKNAPNGLVIATRQMGGHGGPQKLMITPSRWQWHKFKDMFHFYVALGVIPCGALVLYSNIFIGPATLKEIPEDHIPQPWEYYSHPISRFFAKYLVPTHQKDYEKYLHYIYEEKEKQQMRLLETKVKKVMAERGDSQAYYYRPILAKYHRNVREEYDKLEKSQGM